MTDTSLQPARRWNPRSIALIVLAWLVLHIGGLFNPGLLDDVDSIYIEIAREMLHSHDYVTPYVDGIRFFDKPPLLYWLAAGSMRVFGETDWAARLPLALLTLALFLAVYALGLRLFSERAALYSAVAIATSIGTYLYTRFFIPDIAICLWMTLGIHAFLIALDRLTAPPPAFRRSAVVPCLAFAATLAVNLLTKGLIGVIFPIAFVLLYLSLTRQLQLLPRLHPVASTAVFLAIAAPWHMLAALRNPAIPLPPGIGLPARAGWAWFYLYNEHVARFLGTRVPHDYGQTPVPLFWFYAILWMMPWAAFLPASIVQIRRALGHHFAVTVRERQAALVLTLWAGVVLLFFTFSSRQEYYSLPALPALALMIGSALARADQTDSVGLLVPKSQPLGPLSLHLWLLLPIATLVAMICTWFAVTAPPAAPGVDLSTLLAQNPELYNVSLGHLFDLTSSAMGLFRGPLAVVAAGTLTLGPLSYMLRRAHRAYAANLTLAAGMTLVLLAAHEGLVRFNPILGSKSLADAILAEQHAHAQPDDLILLDGEYTMGSTIPFYTRQPAHVVDGRFNGLWFGSFYPDAPKLFETNATLLQLWAGPRRLFLLTDKAAARSAALAPLAYTRTLASAGGKSILTNRP